MGLFSRKKDDDLYIQSTKSEGVFYSWDAKSDYFWHLRKGEDGTVDKSAIPIDPASSRDDFFNVVGEFDQAVYEEVMVSDFDRAYHEELTGNAAEVDAVKAYRRLREAMEQSAVESATASGDDGEALPVNDKLSEQAFSEGAARLRRMLGTSADATEDGDLAEALDFAASRRVLEDGLDGDRWRRIFYHFGGRAYDWRSVNGTSDASMTAMAEKALSATSDPTQPRAHHWVWAASALLRAGAPIEQTFPGGVLSGEIYLRAAYHHTKLAWSLRLAPEFEPPCYGAFRHGVALFEIVGADSDAADPLK